MKNYEFLVWAYNLIWIGIAGYLLSMVLRMRGLGRRLERLEREIARTASQAPPGER